MSGEESPETSRRRLPPNVALTPEREPSADGDSHLLDEQLLAHGDALVEPLLVFLQELLLVVDLPPQVTVGLRKNNDTTRHRKSRRWKP